MKADRFWRIARFALIGGVNTAVDFTILLISVKGGMPLFWANVLSTTAAFMVSYFLNRTFVFRDSGKSGFSGTKQFLLFAVVTFAGLWLLQPLIITGVDKVFGSLLVDYTLRIGVGKLVATGVTMVWNYVLYSRFVFRSRS